MANENVNVTEDFSCGNINDGETYNPGTLYNLCVKKVTDLFWIHKFTKEDLPPTIIGDLYIINQEKNRKRYVNSLIQEFNQHSFESMPYLFSPNLFDAIMYSDEYTKEFHVDQLIMKDWPDLWRITFYIV